MNIEQKKITKAIALIVLGMFLSSQVAWAKSPLRLQEEDYEMPVYRPSNFSPPVVDARPPSPTPKMTVDMQNITYTDAQNEEVKIVWGYIPISGLRYEVWRRAEGESEFVHIGTTEQGANSFIDEDVGIGGEYTYKVRLITDREDCQVGKEETNEVTVTPHFNFSPEADSSDTDVGGEFLGLDTVVMPNPGFTRSMGDHSQRDDLTASVPVRADFTVSVYDAELRLEGGIHEFWPDGDVRGSSPCTGGVVTGDPDKYERVVITIKDPAIGFDINYDEAHNVYYITFYYGNQPTDEELPHLEFRDIEDIKIIGGNGDTARYYGGQVLSNLDGVGEMAFYSLGWGLTDGELSLAYEALDRWGLDLTLSNVGLMLMLGVGVEIPDSDPVEYVCTWDEAAQRLWEVDRANVQFFDNLRMRNPGVAGVSDEQLLFYHLFGVEDLESVHESWGVVIAAIEDRGMRPDTEFKDVLASNPQQAMGMFSLMAWVTSDLQVEDWVAANTEPLEVVLGKLESGDRRYEERIIPDPDGEGMSGEYQIYDNRTGRSISGGRCEPTVKRDEETGELYTTWVTVGDAGPLSAGEEIGGRREYVPDPELSAIGALPPSALFGSDDILGDLPEKGPDPGDGIEPVFDPVAELLGSLPGWGELSEETQAAILETIGEITGDSIAQMDADIGAWVADNIRPPGDGENLLPPGVDTSLPGFTPPDVPSVEQEEGGGIIGFIGDILLPSEAGAEEVSTPKPDASQLLEEFEDNFYEIQPLIDKYGGEYVVQVLGEAAINEKSEPACSALKEIVLNNPGLAQDALSALEKAAIQGVPGAYARLGEIAVNLPDSRSELAKKVVSFLEKAAVQGSSESYTELGIIALYKPNLITKNTVSALEKAAVQGSSEACIALGRIARYNPELAQDAISALEQAAAEGNSDALVSLRSIVLFKPELAQDVILTLERLGTQANIDACGLFLLDIARYHPELARDALSAFANILVRVTGLDKTQVTSLLEDISRAMRLLEEGALSVIRNQWNCYLAYEGLLELLPLLKASGISLSEAREGIVFITKYGFRDIKNMYGLVAELKIDPRKCATKEGFAQEFARRFNEFGRSETDISKLRNTFNRAAAMLYLLHTRESDLDRADTIRTTIIENLDTRSVYYLLSLTGATSYSVLTIYETHIEPNPSSFIQELETIDPEGSYSVGFLLTLADYSLVKEVISAAPGYFISVIGSAFSQPENIIGNSSLLTSTFISIFQDDELSQYKPQVESLLLAMYEHYSRENNIEGIGAIGYLIKLNSQNFSDENRSQALQIADSLPEIMPPTVPEEWLSDNTITSVLRFHTDETWDIETKRYYHEVLGFSEPKEIAEGTWELTKTINGVTLKVIITTNPIYRNGEVDIFAARSHIYHNTDDLQEGLDTSASNRLIYLGGCVSFRLVSDLNALGYQGNYFISDENVGEGEVSNDVLYYITEAIALGMTDWGEIKTYVTERCGSNGIVYPHDKSMLLFDFIESLRDSGQR